jgi:glutamine amidotransferase
MLGLSANVPTDICFSFTGLVQRGGRTGPHRDGWGLALYEGRSCRFFHDPRASVASEIAELLQRHAIKSRIIIGHIRRANRGRVCLANTHPFTRELWGTAWTFAHNGQLRHVKKRRLRHYRPVGTTDSEHAFCWLLDAVRAEFRARPATTRLWRFVGELLADLNTLGAFNVLMSDSAALYAHCSTRLGWITRRHPFGKARLIDTGMVVDFRRETTPKDIVTVVASRPLTDNEEWRTMHAGDLEVFVDGVPQLRIPTTPLGPIAGAPRRTGTGAAA